MSHSWKDVFHLANEGAKAKVEDSIKEGMDPKIQLNMAIQTMQEQYGKLKTAAATVMANRDRQQQRRDQTQREIDRLTASIKTAAANNRMDDARRMAVNLDSQQQLLAQIEQELPSLNAAADDAKHHLDAFAQAMEEKMRERVSLMNQLDQAKANEQLDTALKSFSDISGDSIIPSFDDISDKIQNREALARNSVALNAADPHLAELDAHVQEQNDRADSILASILQPAEITQGNTVSAS
jgi:phage shock protein A